ncbi:MAG: VacJ family lipoprotein [Gammaproteobacteria bacterium]|nr:VacJ family lipoprotein [Gammaproteobacteria bacterium]MDH4255642.1 VacJ family lipoprotein [Gammaproteobacteria bacterium]MDH5310716.1 VacJ family lipoprotein [Gammaproteobacteria bacterium]
MIARSSLLLGLTILLGACAGNPPAPKEARSAADPWEPLNRPIHSFNSAYDAVLLKPIAKGYEFVVPSFMRQGVTNFSRNLREPLHAINNLLQGKGGAAMNDVGRFMLNSTFGVLGIFDWATGAGIERSEEDFGQTLAVWGVPAGPYIVVPFLGPNTLRDALMIPLNLLADPLLHYDNSSVRDKLYVLRLVDVRQRLFVADDLLKDSKDRYITIRESFLQRRTYQIYDGNPPVNDEFYDDFLEEDEIR